MTTTAIDRSATTILATTAGFGIEGMEGLTPEDMIVPRWDILQPTSRKDGTPGHYSLNLTGETRESIEAVILRVTKTRVLWSGVAGERVPECSSLDGLTGRTYGECAQCEYKRWQDASMKVCKAGYTYLCASPENAEDLFMISVYGASVTNAKVLNSVFIQKHRSPFLAVVRWKTAQQIGDKGKYFTHQPSIVNWMSPEQAAPFAEMSRVMLGVVIREVDPETTADATGQNGTEPATETATAPAQDASQAIWDEMGKPLGGEIKALPAAKPAAGNGPARRQRAPF